MRVCAFFVRPSRPAPKSRDLHKHAARMAARLLDRLYYRRYPNAREPTLGVTSRLILKVTETPPPGVASMSASCIRQLAEG